MIKTVQHYFCKGLEYAPVVGAASGVIAGIGARLWRGIPATFQLPAGTATPVFPAVNSVMQKLLKGAGKYGITFAPWAFLTGKAVWKSAQERNWEPLKKHVFSYETLFATSVLASTLFSVMTHSEWVGQGMKDLSDHVLVVLGFSGILTTSVQAIAKGSFLNIASGAASSLFLFNTTRYYHTLGETLSGFGVGTALLTMSHFFAKKFSSKRP